MANFIVPVGHLTSEPDFTLEALLVRGGSVKVGFALELGEEFNGAVRQVIEAVERHHGEVVEHFVEPLIEGWEEEEPEEMLKAEVTQADWEDFWNSPSIHLP